MDQATWSIDHHYFGTDLIPGRAAEGLQEWQQESRRSGVGRQVDGQADLVSYAFRALLTISWKLFDEEVVE